MLVIFIGIRYHNTPNHKPLPSYKICFFEGAVTGTCKTVRWHGGDREYDSQCIVYEGGSYCGKFQITDLR